MMTATPLVQEPRPTLVGERVNSQGSRKAKELLLADDYDGLAPDRRGPGDRRRARARRLRGAHRAPGRGRADAPRWSKRISLTQPAPIQVDSTEPDVIKAALEQIPGRAIVNSINLEAGRDKLDRVVPLAKAHGAALIALTIDEVGHGEDRRAQGRGRQAHRRARLRRARARPRGADLRRAHVHAHHRRRGVEAVARSRRSRASAASRPSCRA